MILATRTEVRLRKSIFLPTGLQQITQEMDWIWTRNFVVTGRNLDSWNKESQVGTYNNS